MRRDAFHIATQALDETRNDVVRLESIAKGPPQSPVADRQRAYAYISVAATLEVYLPSLMDEIFSELVPLSLAMRDIRLSLLSVIVESKLRAIGSTAAMKKRWPKIVELLTSSSSSDPADFSHAEKHLDGKTIRPIHFELLWTVFGLDGAAIRTTSDRAALEELAELRNAIAHGREKASSVAARKSAADILGTISRVEAHIQHVEDRVDDYLQMQRYKR
jgi:hypothetical protein